jgi:hypothetical protein
MTVFSKNLILDLSGIGMYLTLYSILGYKLLSK